jgi:hypothetical protein
VQIFPLLPFPALIALFLMAALHAHQPHDCLLATHQTAQQCLLDLASGTAPSLAQLGRMLSIECYPHHKFPVLFAACFAHDIVILLPDAKAIWSELQKNANEERSPSAM